MKKVKMIQLLCLIHDSSEYSGLDAKYAIVTLTKKEVALYLKQIAFVKKSKVINAVMVNNPCITFHDALPDGIATQASLAEDVYIDYSGPDLEETGDRLNPDDSELSEYGMYLTATEKYNGTKVYLPSMSPKYLGELLKRFA